MNPLFSSERLDFCLWQPQDIDLAHQLWGDPQVSRYLCAGGVFTPQEVEARLALEMENYQHFGLQYFPLFLKTTGDFAGVCGLRPHSLGVAELGVHLLPRCQRQGYGSEACRRVMAWGLSTLGLHGFFAGHNPQNAPSRQLLLGLGFVHQGDCFYPPTGLYHPSYTFTPPRA